MVSYDCHELAMNGALRASSKPLSPHISHALFEHDLFAATLMLQTQSQLMILIWRQLDLLFVYYKKRKGTKGDYLTLVVDEAFL